METIFSGLLGVAVGGIGVGYYFYKQNSNLYSQVLDKQTIIKLIKEHMAKSEKPKRTYKKRTNRKYNTKKKYERAS